MSEVGHKAILQTGRFVLECLLLFCLLPAVIILSIICSAVFGISCLLNYKKRKIRQRGYFDSANADTAGKRAILVVGLEQVIDKIGRHYQLLGKKLESSTIIYSMDANKCSGRFASRYGLQWYDVPRGGFSVDIVKFWQILFSHQPLHVEMYLYGAQSFIAYFGYYIALLVTRIPLVVVCRGGELYYWKKHGPMRKLTIWIGLLMSKVVVYKQLHMPQQLDDLHISTKKRIFFYNRVPVTENWRRSAGDILFLNSWRNFRRPDIMFDVAMRLAPEFPSVRFTIAGARNAKESLDAAGILT
ncbi:MAG: hypothetical protein PHG65_06525 [Kiritimatiellae bacterium]|nr:hypothetical protein [Kiritimatiellia bacterium]